MFVNILFLLMADIDECQNGPVCQQNADCLNMPGSFRCECKAGYRFTSTGQCLGKVGHCKCHWSEANTKDNQLSCHDAGISVKAVN